MTYTQIAEVLEKRGTNVGYLAVGRMMDYIEKQTGKWPDWDDEAPEWVIQATGVK